jgi:hypothetical protein
MKNTSSKKTDNVLMGNLTERGGMTHLGTEAAARVFCIPG